jgi:hypothetical protein
MSAALVGERRAYEQAVWSWSRHLGSGGSTMWQDWLAQGATDEEPVPPGWSPPGAAQLEFLRRVAARHDLPPSALRAVAGLVTGRSGPGRGLGQQPLSWPGPRGVGSGPRFGAPPVDPSSVPAEELVRVGSGTLTDLLLSAPEPASEEPPRRTLPTRRRRARSPAFALAGAPVTTSAVRRALELAGHVEGGFAPRVVLLAEPFDYALAQAWSARVQRGAPVRWHGFVGRWAGRRELPPSVDLAALAGHWSGRVGPDAVHVVVAPNGFEDAARRVAEVLRVGLARRRRPTEAAGDACRDLSPAAVDVARRVNAVLGVRVRRDRHLVVLSRLVRLLAGPGHARGHTLTVPAAAQDWAQRRGEQLAGDLSAGGYRVHGSLDGVLPRLGALATHPRREDALEVVVTACVRQARLNTGRPPAVQEAGER